MLLGYVYLALQDDTKDSSRNRQNTTLNKPQKGGTLNIAVEDEPTILNPFLPEGTSMATKLVTSNILWGLLVHTPDLDYAPRIAKSVPTVENGLVKLDPFTVTYEIKDEAIWSDGAPITAYDIRFTWETIMNPKNRIADRSGYDKIAKIDTPFENTARIVFKEPYASYKELFSSTHPILPRHKLEGRPFNEILNELLTFASGPYKLKEWKHGDHLTLTRNDGFWGQAPYIDKVVYIYDKKERGRFPKGKASVLYAGLSRGDQNRLKEQEGLTVSLEKGLLWEQIGFNTARPPLNDVNVRAAVAHAVNRERLAREATGRPDVLNSVIVPEQASFYQASWSNYDFNLGKVASYLENAGYKKEPGGFFEKAGRPLTLTLSVEAGNSTREKLARTLQADFNRVGIKLVVKKVDSAAFFNSDLPNGNFELGLWAWLAGTEPQLEPLFAADKVAPIGQNYYRYNNPAVTGLLKRVNTTTDPGARAQLYRQIQLQISSDYVTVPLFQHSQGIVRKKTVRGVINNVTYEGPFWELGKWWIEKKKSGG